MDRLKHSLHQESSHSLIQKAAKTLYHKEMQKQQKKQPTHEQIEIGKRIAIAISSLGKGGQTYIAGKAVKANGEQGITPQSVTGWVKYGRISKENLMILEKETNHRAEWILSGQGEKLKSRLPDTIAQSELESNGHLTHDLIDFIRVPIVGNAQLGDNGYWCELEYPVGHGDGYVKYAARDKNAYALRCVGDSMKPRIRDGEFVIVEPSYEPQPGDDVMVKAIDGRVMVKTYLYTRDNRVHLMSINEAHPPQSFALSEIEKMHPIAGTANRLAFVKS
jgi:phage repressor protein C with HTH and peptisase S24 domain